VQEPEPEPELLQIQPRPPLECPAQSQDGART
jgi:hypothetical protein